MNPGIRKHRITFEEPALSKDSVGGSVFSSRDVTTVWGAVHTTSGREFSMERQATAELTHEINIRPVTGILPTWTLRYTDRGGLHRLTIHAIIDNQDHLILRCREIF